MFCCTLIIQITGLYIVAPDALGNTCLLFSMPAGACFALFTQFFANLSLRHICFALMQPAPLPLSASFLQADWVVGKGKKWIGCMIRKCFHKFPVHCPRSRHVPGKKASRVRDKNAHVPSPKFSSKFSTINKETPNFPDANPSWS